MQPVNSNGYTNNPEGVTSVGGSQQRTWLLAAHLGGPAAALISGGFLGFIAPLLVLLLQGNNDLKVREHSVEALNATISYTVYYLIASALVLLLIGFILAPVVAILYLVFSVQGAVAANEGRTYRYPGTFRLVK